MAPEVSPALQALDWSGCVLGLVGAYTLAFRLPFSRYGWFAFLAANVAYIALARATGLNGFLIQQLGFTGSTTVAIYRYFIARAKERDAVDVERAWRISVGLAALPSRALASMPAELALLVDQAKQLHPDAARSTVDADNSAVPSSARP